MQAEFQCSYSLQLLLGNHNRFSLRTSMYLCIPSRQRTSTSPTPCSTMGMTLGSTEYDTPFVMITEDLGTHLAAGRWGSKVLRLHKQQCWNVIYTGNDRCW